VLQDIMGQLAKHLQLVQELVLQDITVQKEQLQLQFQLVDPSLLTVHREVALHILLVLDIIRCQQVQVHLSEQESQFVRQGTTVLEEYGLLVLLVLMVPQQDLLLRHALEAVRQVINVLQDQHQVPLKHVDMGWQVLQMYTVLRARVLLLQFLMDIIQLRQVELKLYEKVKVHALPTNTV
jgi:hypothetical protein